MFSYTGGFSVYALINGAKEVTSVDVSSQALKNAKENANLNSYSGIHKTITGDAFEVMKQFISEDKTFDIVVIDPPSFAKNKKEIIKAKKKYAMLANLGHQLTAPKGLLVLSSCSSRILAKEFFNINNEALKEWHRDYSKLYTSLHDIDHPVMFEEGAYLKTGFYLFSK